MVAPHSKCAWKRTNGGLSTDKDFCDTPINTPTQASVLLLRQLGDFCAPAWSLRRFDQIGGVALGAVHSPSNAKVRQVAAVVTRQKIGLGFGGGKARSM